MPKPNKSSQIKTSKTQHEDSAPKMMLLSGPHFINNMMSGRVACGKYINGWTYGKMENILCKNCKATLEENNDE